MRWTMRASSDRETACDVQVVSGKVNRRTRQPPHADAVSDNDASAPGGRIDQ
jgi:hypothetical protein